MQGKQAVIKLRVVPGASKEDVAGLWMDAVKIKVTAAPEDGKANDAIIALLAKRLNIPKKQIELLKGCASRDKLVGISGLDEQTILARLGLTS